MSNTNTLENKEDEKLEENFEKVSVLIDNLTTPASYNKIIQEKDKPVDYVFLKVNKAFEKLTGFSSQTNLGKKFTQVFSKDYDELTDWINVYSNVTSTGIPTELEKYSKYLKKWLHIHVYSPEKDCFLKIIEDVTERKILEANLDKSDQKLKQFSTSKNGIWIVDDGGYTTYINTKMASTLGYSTEEINGKSFFDFLNERAKAIAREVGMPFEQGKNN
jgi:PAS domain S-box-containing protein